MAFNFSPVNGLLDSNTFPTNPGSETEARQQFMTLFNQIKDFINNLNLDEWSKSLGITGYQRLPSGLIIQWGRTSVAGGTGSAYVNFPIEFPQGLYSLACFPKNTGNGDIIFTHSDETGTGFRTHVRAFSGSAFITPQVAETVKWIAIGS